MELHRVTLEHYRAFDSADWELAPTGLVLVAGANNSGKSTLLSALDVIAGTMGYEPGLGYKNAQSSQPPTITATFRLSATTRNEILNQIEGFPHEFYEEGGFFQEVQLVFRLMPNAGFSIASVHASWPSGGMVCVAQVDMRGINNGSVHAIAPNQSGNTTGSVGLSERLSGSIDPSLESHLGQVPELAPVLRELSVWRSRFYHFKALRGGSPRSMSLSSQPRLDPTGSNLPAVLLDLQTNRSQLMEELRRLISQMVPDVGRLETPTLNNQLEVAFSDPFNPGFRHNLKELGTGVEQLLLTLIVGLTEESPSTLVVEEPETNLHPAAQRALLGLLNSWAAHRQIIVATHSPVMLDWTSGGNQLWQVSRTEGNSHLATVDERPVELLRSLGVRLSDVLSADRILVAEGPSDVDILGTWFPEVMRNPRVSIISGGGGDNARIADLFANWIAQADQLGLRRVLYLRDRDELSPETIEKLLRSGSVHVLDCREIENYLLHPEVISSLFAEKSDVRTQASPDAVREVMLRQAKDLSAAMVVNRVARQLPLVHLMDHKTRGELARRGATEDEFWQVIEARLPERGEMRDTIRAYWNVAVEEVSAMSNTQLLRKAPGEEILDSVYMHFLGRHFKKRKDGGELASAMEGPPDELATALNNFMSETGGERR